MINVRRELFTIPVLVASLVGLVSCKSKDAVPAPAAGSWQRDVETRRAQIEKVKAENKAGFEAMDSGSLGGATLEMTPYVVFRVLQDVEPAAFSDASLSARGFSPRQDMPSGHNGIIWTEPTQVGSLKARYFTRTCSSCHTARVRLADGTMRLMFGGSNTEIGLHGFIGRLTSTLKADLGASASEPAYQAFRKRILEGLAGHEAGWFFGASSKTVPPEDAAKEVAAVTANIDAVLQLMRTMNDKRMQNIALLQDHSYAKVPNPPSLAGGAPGLIETSGLGSVGLVAFVPKAPESVLPPGPAKADIPAIWQIDSTGYANWDGTVRGFARALTSSMAVVGDPTKIDLASNARIQAFLGKLPSEPYPFPIDDAARHRGEAVYQTNCAGCHMSPAGKTRNELVFDVGTDPLRSQAMSGLAASLLSKVLVSICPQTQPECAFGPEGPVVDPSAHRGYVATPLPGAWAIAPYLHNGSVPTLRQLLVPSLRTTAPFLRGSTSYNQVDGGWEWEPQKEAAMRAKGDVALALHDLGQAGFSPVGHGSDSNPRLVDGQGKSVRVVWSNSAEDKRVVDDLIAYLLSL